MVLLVVFSLTSAEIEMPALNNPLRYALMISVLMIAAFGLYELNRHRAKSAIIYFEDLPPELITSLGLVSAPQRTRLPVQVCAWDDSDEKSKRVRLLAP
jgi:hypothetical protein